MEKDLHPSLYPPPSYENSNNEAPAVVLTGPIGFVPYQPTYEQAPNPLQYNPYPNPPTYSLPPPPPPPPPPPVQFQSNRRDNHENQLVFSIVNAVIFFPMAFLWIPAIIYSLKSRACFDAEQFAFSNKYGRRANNFNIGCLVSGNKSVLLSIITLDKHYSNQSYIK